MNWMRARSSRAPASHRTREARARDRGRALEVEDAELRAEVPVRLRREVEGARRRRRAAPRRSPSRRGPTGTLASGTFGTTMRKRSIASFTSSSRASPCLIRSATPFISAFELRGVLLRLAAPRDLLSGEALAVAQLLDLLDERAPLGVERPGVDAGEPGEGLDLREVLAAAREHLEHGLSVVDDVLQVEHVAGEDSTRKPRSRPRASIVP